MNDLSTKYTIVIAKEGAGAAAAVADFKAVETAAKSTNAAIATGAAPLNTVNTATKGTIAGLKSMQGAMTIIGMQTMPQLTMGAIAVKEGFHAVELAAEATGISVAKMSGIVAAGLLGAMEIASFIKENIGLFNDVSAASKANEDRIKKVESQAEQLRDFIIKAVEEGRLTLDKFTSESFDKMLDTPTIQRLNLIRAKLKELFPPGEFMTEGERNKVVSNALNAQDISAQHSSAALAFNNPNMSDSAAKELAMVTIQSQYNDQVKLFNSLRARGMITEDQLRDKTMIADTTRMQSLTQLRGQLTQIQQLEKAVGESFASGLSSAIVSAFKEGGKALQQFASQFFAQVAQMILQMMILRGLKAVFGGTLFGATGGFFAPARMMAAGGMQGVQTVSSATYFPSHNVVAGEAGTEIMTVLARPRFMQVGGMQAMVGMAGGNKLAITDADKLAAGGAGSASGSVQIHVSMEPGLRAAIVSDSVKGAVVKVTQDMSKDSTLSRTTKQLR